MSQLSATTAQISATTAKTMTEEMRAPFARRIIAITGMLTGVALIMFMTSGAALAKAAPDSFADLAEKLLPTVVNVATEQEATQTNGRRRGGRPTLPPGSPFQDFFDEFFDNQRRGENGDNDRSNRNDDENDERRPAPLSRSLGSGFIVDSEGYIVTNNHVIGEATKITVTLSDGEELEATLVGRDALLDVALLKVEADHPLPAVKWGSSGVIRVGDWIMAIGNPYGLGGSVTAGIISALERDINAGPYDFFIQTDASINRGNSGGPMFNMDGEVIGMNTMIFSPTGGNIGIGFAIPSDQAKRVVDQLREFGRTKRGWIGVSIQPVTEDVAASLGLEKAEGAIVGSVVPGGPSDKAGVEPGDIILTFDGEAIKTSNELPRVVSSTPVNKTVKVRIVRKGRAQVIELTTGELEAQNQLVASAADPDVQPEAAAVTDRVLGMRLAPLDGAAREQYEVPDDVHGVVIAGLSRSSEAALRGLRRGDVIVEVNQAHVDGAVEIKLQVEAAREAERRAILLRIYRQGAFLHVALPIGDAEG